MIKPCCADLNPPKQLSRPSRTHAHHPPLPPAPPLLHQAVALECMRSAHRARRRALLYAFSGPGDVRELALAPTPDGLADLLAFLRCSFGGGTDEDAPLELALERIEAGGWGDADVLLVTDGELPPPSPAVKARLEAATTDLGLEVHALLVGRADAASDGVRAIATDVHVFRSWSAVGEG